MIKCKVKRLKKIKTVYKVRCFDSDVDEFDNQVNELLNEGWRIAEIRVIEAQGVNIDDVFYARFERWEA